MMIRNGPDAKHAKLCKVLVWAPDLRFSSFWFFKSVRRAAASVRQSSVFR